MAKRVRRDVVKVRVVGGDGVEREATNALDEDARLQLEAFKEANALTPPYDAAALCDLYEDSSSLRQNVDAYVTNVDGGGHRYVAWVDLDADDAEDVVRAAMHEERRLAAWGESVRATVPTGAEVRSRMREVAAEMRAERFRLDAFFQSCTVGAFTSVRQETRTDVEVTGNAYWEVLRGGDGAVSQFNKLPVSQMRLLLEGKEFVEVDAAVRATPLTVTVQKQVRRFRRYVQVVGTTTVYFKEFGDPRVMSAATGRYYPTVQALRVAEPEVAEATEVAHHRIYSPVSPYGVPRWIGTLLAVKGNHSAEEVNYLYFENKSVPPLAIIVSGGRLSTESVRRIEEHIKEKVRGKGNFHKVLVIEGVGADADLLDGNAGGKMKIDLKPLTQAQLSDGQFLKYDERNNEKVGQSFRLPRLLRGDIRDFNRNTSEAALEFAEAQIFGPIRADFDAWVNDYVLPTLGIKYWRFESCALRLRDPRTLAEVIARLTSSNVLVPADARRFAGELVFGEPLTRIDADWVWQPVMLSQVGVGRDMHEDGSIPPPGVGGGDGAAPVEPPGKVEKGLARRRRRDSLAIEAFAKELLAVRDELAAQEAEAAVGELAGVPEPAEDG